MMDSVSEIRERTVACRTLFSQCLSMTPIPEIDWLEDRQGEFNLWVENEKAADDSEFSLDHRVRQESAVYETICDLLGGLSETLESLLYTGTLRSMHLVK
jgi:hypothetical protein